MPPTRELEKGPLARSVGQATVGEIEAGGGSAKSPRTDVSSLEETEMMAEETVKAFGRIDILVNCAATVSGLRRRRFFEIDPGE